MIFLKLTFLLDKAGAKLQHNDESLYTFVKKCFSILARVSEDILILTICFCHLKVTKKHRPV